MQQSADMKNSSTSQNVFLFGVGIVAGWCIKQLFDSREFKSKHHEINNLLENIKVKLADSDEAKKISDIFGKTSQELTDVYRHSKDSLAQELSTLRTSLEEIDKQKYVGIVTGIINELRTQNRLSAPQIEALTKSLTSDFNKIKRNRVKVSSPEKMDTMTDLDQDLER